MFRFHVISTSGCRTCSSLIAILAIIAFSSAVCLKAEVYYVDAGRPDDAGDGLSWPTAMQSIQTAIDSSAAGDTILVKYGVYDLANDIVIGSTRLLTSDDGTHDSWDSAAHDSSLCVVASGVVGRVFTIDGAAVTADTRLRGFKITGGRATSESPGALYGGGVYITNGADPVIEHCWLTGNIASTSNNGYGGGIACRGAGTSAVIRHCTIENNIGSSSWVACGGGLYFEDAALSQVYGNTIVYNTASTARIGYGGGVYTDNSDVLIRSNTISYNVGASPTASAGGRGGGLNIYGGTVKIHDNVITHNHAGERSGYGGNGGGIYIAGAGFGDSILIYDNPAVSFNTAGTAGAGNGGGICCNGPYTWMYGNTIEGNVACSSTNATAANRVGNGGGVLISEFSGITLRDNVVIDNTASLYGAGSGGGVYASTAQNITGNIIAFNVASASVEGGYGGGLWTSSASSGKVYNNTLYRNANTTNPLGAGAGSGWYHSAAGFPAIRNNIFAGHDVAGSDSTGAFSAVAGTIWYNCFHGNPGGDYNVNLTSNEHVLADPRLTDPYNGDFTLMYDSPCIEEGDPAFAVPEHGGWVIDIGALEYTGTRHWRPVTGAGLLLFGGMVKAKVDVTTPGTLSEIDMVVHPGEHLPLAPVSVERWYDIDHVGEGMEFDLTLSYLEEEVGARDEASLVVWRWSGTAWEGPIATSAADISQNWLTVSGRTGFSDWIMTDEWGPTGDEEIPLQTRLFANWPNPFNPSTAISFTLSGGGEHELAVYDVSGRLVKVLSSGSLPGGAYTVRWNGTNARGSAVASGVYFYRLIAPECIETRKMVLMK
ncbi:MAG: FlgD immunoglobulin-like domain containing protein [Candidatus Krumholzibacteria bacterium]|nr:FlgD immunoglobulin-like domain containing protein [Candidatus Krumholzibacteria bacterium]